MGADLGTDSVKSDPNVVPLCDILLVLLIIFMVITPAAQQGIDIQLPEKSSTDPSQIKPTTPGYVLTIEKDSTIKLNQEIVTFEMLESQLRDIYMKRTKKQIFIRADETLPYKEVFRIIDVARGAGIEVLGIMTDKYNTAEEQSTDG